MLSPSCAAASSVPGVIPARNREVREGIDEREDREEWNEGVTHHGALASISSTFAAARPSKESLADDSETIARAILEFIPPTNTMKYDKIRQTGVTSAIYNFGVKLISRDPSISYPSRWYCMTSDDCRKKHRHFSCPDKNTSTVIKHLKDIHNIVNGRSEGAKDLDAEVDGNEF